VLERLFAKLIESMKLLHSDHTIASLDKIFHLLTLKCVRCLMLVVIIVQSRLKLCDLTTVAAVVEYFFCMFLYTSPLAQVVRSVHVLV